MDESLPRDDELEAQFQPVDELVDQPVDVVDDQPVDEPVDVEPDVEPPATIELGSRSYSVDEIRGVVDWVENLTPDQMARIQQALYQQPAPQQPPTDPAVSNRIDPDEVLDPRLAEYVEQRFGRVEEYLERLTSATLQQRQIEASRQEAQLADALSEARSGVAERLGLNDDDLAALTTATEQAGIVAFLAQKHGMNNPRNVFEEALETVYWSTPEFREKAMNVTAEAAADEAAALAKKKSRAGSLSSKGATAPRTKSVTPPNAEEAFAAMVNELAKDLSES